MKKMICVITMMVAMMTSSVQAYAWSPLDLIRNNKDSFLDRQFEKLETELDEKGIEVIFGNSITTVRLQNEPSSTTSRYFSANDVAYVYSIKWEQYDDNIYSVIDTRIKSTVNDEKYTLDEFVEMMK